MAAPQPAGNADASARKSKQALVNRYCVTCHNQKLRTAKLAFDVLDLDASRKGRADLGAGHSQTARRHDAAAGSAQASSAKR